MSSVPDVVMRNWGLADSITSHGVNRRSSSFVEVKSFTMHKLEQQLKKVELELQLKGEEQKKLERVRDQVEQEIDELTANLFEEANKMVIDANVRRMDTEEELKSALTKEESLKAEVEALKTLVESRAEQHQRKFSQADQLSKHVTNQGTVTRPAPALAKAASSFKKKLTSFKRSKSEISVRGSSTSGEMPSPTTPHQASATPAKRELMDDPLGLEEFKSWKNAPTFKPEDSAFINRLVSEDIAPVLKFPNEQVMPLLLADVLANKLVVEQNTDKQDSICGLTALREDCPFILKFSKTDVKPLQICQSVRDKIISVCELISYLNYIKMGLVRSQYDRELYEQIQVLRETMMLRRLGYPRAA